MCMKIVNLGIICIGLFFIPFFRKGGENMTKSEEKSRKISMVIDRKKVLCYMADNNITKPQLRASFGISQPTLLKLLAEKPVSVIVVGKVASAMGVKSAEIIKD